MEGDGGLPERSQVEARGDQIRNLAVVVVAPLVTQALPAFTALLINVPQVRRIPSWGAPKPSDPPSSRRSHSSKLEIGHSVI